MKQATNIDDLISTWIKRAEAAKEKIKNAEVVSWDSIDQLSKATWLLGIVQGL